MFKASPTDIYEIDLTTATATPATTGGIPIINTDGSISKLQLNAFGYNSKDNYIWGQAYNSSNLVRIGSDYKGKLYPVANLPANPYVVGDVSPKTGFMYLAVGGSGATDQIYVIDLTQTTLTATALTTTQSFITDWAVSPIDGNLYAIYSTIINNGTQVNTSKLTLYRYLTKARTINGVTTAAGTRETLGTVAGGSTPIAAANFGAVFMDSNGSFYVVANASGYIHRIDRPDLLGASDESTAIAATYITTGPAATTNNNDGARCANSRVTTTLPVQLAAFAATAAPNRAVRLGWTTASELNNAYFEVQHSLDGRTFAAVGQVQGRGTSAQASTYSFTDAAPGAATTHYYRLRQVDADGTATFSPVQVVTLAVGSSP
ncbi:MAG: hypothetical protein EOO62_34835, partial [Hymenobacter sp.]